MSAQSRDIHVSPEPVVNGSHTSTVSAYLQVGAQWEIRAIRASQQLRQHFLRMGMTLGTVLQIKRLAPFGGVIEVSVRGTRVLLHRETFACLELRAWR